MKSADRLVLQKMIDYCDDITDMVSEFGDSYEAFASRKSYQYATGMCILQIGELVTRLSDETKAAIPSIPWRMIRGMRNIYAHNYEHTKLITIWQTLSEDIPALRDALKAALEQ